MASSIMHLAIIENLVKDHSFKDPNRLKFGAVLPDAGSDRNCSHFKSALCGRNKKTYDVDLFRTRFKDLILKDDLYLGYYLHLVQDICYRHFVYDRYHWNPNIPGNVDKLHNDYSILNGYVIKKYGMKNDLIIPGHFDKEPLNEICSFDIPGFMEALDVFFNNTGKGDIFFFTKEMSDEFINEATELCNAEIKALYSGGALMDSYNEAWEDKPRSLLETTLNTRDLGGYRIEGTDRLTRYNKLFRSDVANYPSQRDIEFLKEKGITTIIDSRTLAETEKKPHGLDAVEGFDYYNFPIDEGSGIPESIEAVPGSYFAIAHSGEIGKIFRTMGEAKEGVMFNCSAGKDRTGVISALILWLCGVSKQDIVFDYMRTKRNNEPRFELIRQNFPGLDMNIVIPNERFIRGFMDMITERYGTIEAYFTAIGIDDGEQQKIKEKLL